jgi:plastocyanin
MTRMIQRHWQWVMAACVAVVATVAVLPLVADRGPAPRTVVLVAKGMGFALEDRDGLPNPVLRVTAGERVRLVLRNETPGMSHDLAIPAWGVTLDAVRGGASSAATFTVPEDAATVEYLCQPHSRMMRGTIEVTPR